MTIWEMEWIEKTLQEAEDVFRSFARHVDAGYLRNADSCKDALEIVRDSKNRARRVQTDGGNKRGKEGCAMACFCRIP